MSNHTPGPWNVDFSRDSNGVVDCADAVAVCTSDNHNLDICAVWNDIPEGSYEANANLIAAAPDILEALKMSASLVKDYAKSMGCDPENWPEYQAAMAAIAKAEGE